MLKFGSFFFFGYMEKHSFEFSNRIKEIVIFPCNKNAIMWCYLIAPYNDKLYIYWRTILIYMFFVFVDFFLLVMNSFNSRGNILI